ncbi:MAG: DNA polymerase III subunit gamma/tau [Alphaproteobacteria bacterium]|jgi:DNA polymerase-3 subunit gamma/tau|nr:DNA polymerase III subunit gamma/tau [Alphaproteobacteria bacterium]
MSENPESTGYRVLARKYRPGTFDELIGQEALVRILTNAIESGRIAHAYMLTGVRGVGKTTTARIIARALNCIGADGTLDGPTPTPCGECENCVAIRDDRHVDVMEMDAASRTGIDDIRELIEGVRYKPTSARYKVYIIDEVHMLSRQAFNGLLKTLEEPPEHVIFVFATTEPRKVPITVQSRCQRFDLRRIDTERLIEHFAGVAEAEGISVEPEALAMIARAADGSVRDGLSLLDQAISPDGGPAGDPGAVTADHVQNMLSLADRAVVFDLLDALMAGDVKAALDIFATMHRDGADPVVVVQDLLEAVYWVTRIKAVPSITEETYTPETEGTRGKAMAENLSMAALARVWQMLMKGLGEVQTAPMPAHAAEMLLVRLAYAAELPPPAVLMQQIKDGDGATETPAAPATPAASGLGGDGGSVQAAVAGGVAESAAVPEASRDPAPEPTAEARQPSPQNFQQAVELFRDQREMIAASHLTNDVNLVSFEVGRIEFRAGEHAPRDLANKTASLLSDWTGERWVVTVSGEAGEATLAEQAEAAMRQLHNEAEADPLVKAVKDAFPGARVTKVTPREADGDIPDDPPDAFGDDPGGDEIEED